MRAILGAADVRVSDAAFWPAGFTCSLPRLKFIDTTTPNISKSSFLCHITAQYRSKFFKNH
jgi:hypothetical protein